MLDIMHADYDKSFARQKHDLVGFRHSSAITAVLSQQCYQPSN
jgi:hypothetical protein